MKSWQLALGRSQSIAHGLKTLNGASARLASVALSLVFGILAARLAGSKAFGDYVSLMAVAGFLGVAVSAGLPGLLLRETAAARGGEGFEGLIPLVHLCAVVLGFSAVALAASAFLPTGEVRLVIAFAVIGSLASLLAGVHSGWERVLFSTWINGALRPLVAIAVLLGLSQGLAPSLESMLWAQVIGAAAVVLVFLLRWRPSEIVSVLTWIAQVPQWSQRHIEALKAGLAFAAGQLLINAMTQIDVIVMTLVEPDGVAHYYAAARAALVVSFFFGASATLAEPKLSKLHAAGDRVALDRTLRSTALSGLAVTVASSTVALALAPTYLGLYGPSFEEALPTLVVLMAGLLIWSLFGPAQAAMRAVRLERRLIVVTAIAVLINVVLSLALIPFFGGIGAAIGTTVQFLAYGMMMTWAVFKATGHRTDVFYWLSALHFSGCWRAKTPVVSGITTLGGPTQMNSKQAIKGIATTLAPQLTAEILAWRSQRIIMAGERRSGRLDASVAFCSRFGPLVRRGPFEGLRYPIATCQSRNLVPKLVASYEDELHHWFEEVVFKRYPTIVNVGSADGYYTVGLALRCPEARIIAFDTDRWARKATLEMARENATSNVEVRSMCTPRWVRNELQVGSLLLIDCEGFEAELLDFDKAPNLCKCDVLVELHEHVVAGVGDLVRRRFGATHDIRAVGSRHKSVADYPEMCEVAPAMRELALSEGRHAPQTWLYLTRKGNA
jgi:O-antigen/teichoic acid export membrane protein